MHLLLFYRINLCATPTITKFIVRRFSFNGTSLVNQWSFKKICTQVGKVLFELYMGDIYFPVEYGICVVNCIELQASCNFQVRITLVYIESI